MKMKKEAIDEIMYLLNEVNEVVSLLKQFGIDITSDPWTATSFSDEEDILTWNRKSFERLKLPNSENKFFIGGNIITGTMHEYKNKWIIAPKKLAEIQGEIFEKYLKKIIKETSLKHFTLNFSDKYGLIDNGGWEHFMSIDATIKQSGLIKGKDEIISDYKNLLEFNGELNYKIEAGQTNKEVYEYSGFIDYLKEICDSYNIKFNEKEIDWEWCNYIQNKSNELEKTIEQKLNLT